MASKSIYIDGKIIPTALHAEKKKQVRRYFMHVKPKIKKM